MRFRFGRYELDDEAGELRRDGTPVAIQPKPLALLVHLVRERERVVPFEELYELLWPDVAVTPSSLTRAVSVARSAIGDTGRRRRRSGASRPKRHATPSSAATHYQQALDALGQATPVDAARRLETLLQLGDAHGLAGDRERRRSVFDRALSDARAQNRPLDLARAAIGFCDIAEWAPADDDAVARLHEALEALPADAERERAQVLTRLGYLSARHYYARALPTAREALELARRSGDARIHQDAIYGLHFLLAGPDHFEERRALAAEAVESTRSGVVTDAGVITVLDDSSDRLLLGDREGARAMRALADELAGRSPLLGRRWNMRVYDSGVALLEGRVADCERLADEAATLGTRIQHPYARGVQRMLRVVLAHHRDDAAEVLRWYDPNHKVRFGPQQWVGAVTARALAAVGRLDEARAGYEELLAGAGFEGIPRNIRWSRTVIEFAHLCADVGDEERAPALLEWLRPYQHHHGVLPMAIAYGGPMSYAMARLAELLDRGEEADALYAEAIEACRDLGARPMVARILVAHAALLARRGDKRAARACVEEAGEIAEATGMPGIALRAEKLAAAR